MKKIMINWISKVVVGTVVMALSVGCAVLHAPKAEPIAAGSIPQIQGKGTIAVINSQGDKTVQKLGRAGFGSLQGDLNSWTEAAVTLLSSEVGKAGLKVQADGKKSIKVSVVEVKLGVAGIDFVAGVPKGKVRIKVETGDGYMKEYSAEKKAMQPPAACEKALTEAVLNILKDEKIVGYLKQ